MIVCNGEARFWSKVDKNGDNGCWNWFGTLSNGYGTIGIDYKYLSVHRYSYELHNGPIPEGSAVMSTCENNLCVNPDHLFIYNKGADEERTAERFWSRVEKTEMCWDWIGYRNTSGYGEFSARNRPISAHRFSYELANGPIPDGLFVCHKCDRPPCVNPEHLGLGTALDNARDRDNKGRGADFRGELCGTTKLKNYQILEIRGLYSSGGITQKEIAFRYEVKPYTINNIVNRKSWKHI
jgi:hypothetical protein